MSINSTGTSVYVDLGDAWLRYQTARIRQRHLQVGRHFRLDFDALLTRAASVTRAARSAEGPAVRAHVSTDHIRRVMIEVVDHYAQRKTGSSARIAEALTD